MTEKAFVPSIPEHAPFTPEQRAYLNGFLAGLFSRAPVPELPEISNGVHSPKRLAILFGSQTGNSESLAKKLAKTSSQKGFLPAVFEMAEYPLEQLGREEKICILTSTFGDGDPPDNAKTFWDFLNSEKAPRLPGLQFSVLALGDANYPKFCECGKQFDRRLEELGAIRVQSRADCDVDYEETFAHWAESVLNAFDQEQTGRPEEKPDLARKNPLSQPATISLEPSFSGVTRAGACYDRKNPFPGLLLANVLLTGQGTAKETRHIEIALDDPEMRYEAGDALGIFPSNCPDLAGEILGILGFTGEEIVPGSGGGPTSFRKALLFDYEITKISRPFLKTMAEKTADPFLNALAGPEGNGELMQFLWGRDILDLLRSQPRVPFSAVEFVSLLKKLQPRLYSISSSPKAYPGKVHLTVGVVRYESHGRKRKGVCSTFLADRAGSENSIPLFIQPSKHFRLPTEGDRPIIMVGPGTGIAPFRAFLQERQATGAGGKSWLFFGEQHAGTHFLYRNELHSMREAGTLTRLDTAFSRDQKEKLYVQHRMLEHAGELYAWLEEGAHFYVCGDAGRMAKDVDAALHRIIELAGNYSSVQSAEYVRRLKKENRYQRDVY